MSVPRKVFFRLVLPIILVALGVAGALAVFRLAPAAARAEPVRQIPFIEVLEARPSQASARVVSTGTVTAAREVVISPEVTGRVVERSPALIPGGRLQEGDLIVRLDSRDHLFAVQQERSKITSAESQLEIERARGKIAEREWSIFGDGRPRDQVPLALREPQLRAAVASLDAAQSGLSRARLNLSRTRLVAPWNAIVIETQAELGQLAGPTTPLATLVGTDEVWVRVSVPVEQAVDLDIPGVNADQGARARVFHDLAQGRTVEWEGRVLRLEGRLNVETRTAQLLVSVNDPFDAPAGGLPLLPGTFVRVELEGRELNSVYSLPRSAVYDGATVWVVDNDNKLASRIVTVGWGTAERVFVTSGLEPGQRVVTTSLALPLEGEPVRIRSGEGGRS